MNQQLATVAPPRLPMPEGLPEHLRPRWKLLCDAIFPAAKTSDGILLAVEYCQARGLDIMKRAVHIVPVWSKQKRAYIESIWPSINEIQVTAARTNAWAGMDSPKFGPMIQLKLSGLKTIWVDRQETTQQVTLELEVPEWCEVTVYRLVQGIRCSFCEPVYWREAYARQGQASELPTDMWVKRPKGQLIKVAKAFSLRAAFPEEAEYSAEEMAGQQIEGEDEPLSPPRPASPPSPPAPAAGLKQQAPPPHDAETGEIEPPHHLEFLDDPQTNEPERWPEWGARLIAAVKTAETEQEIVAWENLNSAKIADMKNENPKLHARLEAAINAHRIKLAATTAGEG